MVAVPASLAQDEATFGLSQSDFVLLAEANTATAAVSSVHFEFTANLAITGMSSGSGTVDLEGNGALPTGDNPALEATLSGQANLGGAFIPLDAQLRIVDGTFFYNFADPNTGELTGWVGQSLEEITNGLTAFVGASLATGGLSGAVSTDELLDVVQPQQFVGIHREDDTQDESHFVMDLDFDALFASGFIEEALAQAAAFNPSAPTPRELMIVFEESTLRVEQWIGLEDKRVHRALLDMVLNVNPAAVGDPANQGIVTFNLDITLDQFDETITIAAPEDATMLSSETATMPVASNQSIAANSPVIVELTGQGPIDVLYTAQDEETINVNVRSVVANTVDTTVEVIDPDGRTLAYNDDRSPSIRDSRLGAFDSAIQELALPGAGVYIIRVGSYNNTGIGEVEVLVESATTTTSSVNPATITDSEIVVGSLTPGGTFAYSFTAGEGEQVTIAVRDISGTLDPRLLLMDSQFSLLAENDDHASDDPALDQFDPKIEDFIAPTAGTYNLLVSDFGGAEGAFQVVILRGGGRVSDFTTLEPINPAGIQPPPDDPNAIILGSAVTLNLDGENAGARTFYGVTGQQITITARANNAASQGIDVYITIFDPSGRALAFNDDHGTGDLALGQRDARITTLTLPANGAYRIEVDSWFDLGGDVTVEVEEG
jgi:hypothetical protein